MRRFTGLTLTSLVLALGLACTPDLESRRATHGDIVKVYLAAKVFTMEPDSPVATAVAVDGDSFLAVGSIVEVEAELEGRRASIDRTFEDKVILPRFVDPRAAPSRTAGRLSLRIVSVTGQAGAIGTGDAPDRESLLAVIREGAASLGGSDEMLVVLIHPSTDPDALSREDLDAVSATRPVIVWNPSSREVLRNAPALEVEIQVEPIAPGNKADFTVLEQDPYAGPHARVKELTVWGSVLDGKPYPLGR